LREDGSCAREAQDSTVAAADLPTRARGRAQVQVPGQAVERAKGSAAKPADSHPSSCRRAPFGYPGIASAAARFAKST
jgi:hypothetical protein